MESGNIYTLIPLEEFKSLLGIDDREDGLYFASMRNTSSEFLPCKNSKTLFQPPSLAAFCLVTATFAIEQYCKRRFLRKKHFERIEYIGDLLLPLREYPVGNVLAVYSMSKRQNCREQLEMSNGKKIDPKSYRVIPDCGSKGQRLTI
jgi:hypothetical protein